MRWISLLSLALVLGGCATNGYEKFYRAYPNAPAASPAKTSATSLKVEHVATANRAMFESYQEQGYAPIGESAFNSGTRQPESDAIKQAEAVGADLVVIVNPRFTGTETTAIPFTTPTTTTAFSSGTATAFGPGGTATAYGSGVTTYYGSKTTYVPMTIHREDYGAVYFIKGHFALGVKCRNLNDAERQTLQTNKGAVVMVVVNGSPAFDADILKGDIITSLDGRPVIDAQSLAEKLKSDSGRVIKLGILRGDKHLEKSIQLQE